MKHALAQFAALAAKDLRIEARSKQTLGLVLVLGILIIVVLGLGLGPQQLANGPAAVAALWVAYLFAGVLCFEGTMAVERHDGALAALLLAPVDRGIIYLAKLAANLVLMLLLAIVLTAVAVLLFAFDLSTAPAVCVLILALSFLGFAAVGTLFAAVVSSSRLQGGLLAMAVFPISLPLVMTSTQMLLRLFNSKLPHSLDGLGILVAFDVIYLVAGWLAFELVLEP